VKKGLNENMIIREFASADIEAAHLLWRSTEGVCKCDKCTELDSRENLEKFMTRNPKSCFIAEIDGNIAGTILAGHDGRTGLIYRLTVSEECREKGIGKALVDRSVEMIKSEGIKVVVAFVLSENEGGNAFWEKIGFTEENMATTRRLRLY